MLSEEQLRGYVTRLGVKYADYLKSGLRLFNSYFLCCPLTPETLALCIQSLEKKRISAYAINNYIKAFKHICRCMGYDYMDSYRMRRTERPHIDILTEEELERVLSCAYRDSYRKAVCLEAFLKTGCRPSELFNVQWTDLHSDELFIHNTKTATSRSVVLLPELCEKIYKLDRYRHGYIFGGVNGRINRAWFNRWLRSILKQCHIDKRIRTKELRHIYATYLAKRGVSTFVIKECMGHTQITTTQGYVHIDKEMRRNAAYKAPGTLYRKGRECVVDEANEFVQGMIKSGVATQYKNEKGSMTIQITLDDGL